MKDKRHHLVLLAAVVGLLVLIAAVVVQLNRPLDPQDKAIEVSELQIYLDLAALTTSALSGVGLWWWKQHLNQRIENQRIERLRPDESPQPPPSLPTPSPVPPAPSLVLAQLVHRAGGWGRRLGHQAGNPMTAIVAATTGLAVDLVMNLFGRTPAQSALTALVTALVAYAASLAIMATGPEPEPEGSPTPASEQPTTPGPDAVIR